MEVNNINNKDLVNNNIRTNKSGKPGNASKSSDQENIEANEEHSLADRVSIDKSNYGDEVQFARQIFKKLGQSTLSKLTDIKVNIKKGTYNNENVHQFVSDQINTSLLSLESHSIQQSNPSESTEEPNLTQEDRERLLNSENIQSEISAQIKKDIQVLNK